MKSTAAQHEAPSHNTEAASLEFREVTKRYPGTEKIAVDSLSLEVPAGEICVLVGPSGCGKTTAMRMVNRMIEISDGDILVAGESVRDRPPAQLRREIGYVIQHIGLFPHKTIGDNIATVPQLLGWDGKRTAARVEELLELIGLTGDFRDRYPAQLSGGQRQRVGVARALAADPPLMLMDEPFGAIDPINRERLQNEFLRLQAELRKTIVFVTHDIDEAIKMGDKIAILKEGGHLAQFAPPAELLMYPAEPFVEDFVGADRALKRLALQRVRDIDLWKAATVRAGEAVADARKKLEDADLDIPLLVDDAGRPLGWLSERGMQGERVRDELRSPAEPIVELDDILRDALSDLLGSDSQYGPVVDSEGKVAGVLSMEVLSHALSQKAENVPTPSELAAHEAHEAKAALLTAIATWLPTLAQITFGDREGAANECPGNNGLCPEWVLDNFNQYWDPLWEHVLLSVIPLLIGFFVATGMALVAHRYTWLNAWFLFFVSALFTVPSIAFYLILLNVTGRGYTTAVVVLTAYTLVLIYRNVSTGLQEVPRDMVDAAEGMGLTRRQILFRVELPMALPTIFAGMRIAASSTVGIAGFAFFAGAGGLGASIFADPTFRGNVVAASLLMVLLATALEIIVLLIQRAATPWGAGGEPMIFAALGPFGDAIDFIFNERESQAGTVTVGGLEEMWELTWTHLQLALVATLLATAFAMPLGIWLGHIGRFQFAATSISNIGRAIPALGLVVFFIAFLGVGFLNVCVALVLLAIPPIITNSYVGIRGVDPETVDAARGNGLTGRQVALQVELPMALPTIMAGIRISLVSVIATATIAPLANVDTLGRPIISPNIYGTAGQLAACIVVALVTFGADALFALFQRAVTPEGLKLAERGRPGGRRLAFLSSKRSMQTS